jgi:hypothetical protein
MESKYEDQTENSERQRRKEENESLEYKFNNTEDSQLFRNFQNNWDNSFAKVDQDQSSETKDSSKSSRLKSENNNCTEQPKFYCLKSRKFKEAKSE